MKFVIAAGAILLSLGACTAGDVATLRELTIEDGARYVNENHERRRDVRQQLYLMEDEVLRKCQDRARALETTGDLEDSLNALDWCFAFLEKAYPDLATFKAIREGRQQFNNLRGEP